jgi:sec-independent protein translocase protein TatA
MRVGIVELTVIVLVIIILFGSKKIPELGKSLGEAIREFKNAIKGEK